MLYEALYDTSSDSLKALIIEGFKRSLSDHDEYYVTHCGGGLHKKLLERPLVIGRGGYIKGIENYRYGGVEMPPDFSPANLDVTWEELVRLSSLIPDGDLGWVRCSGNKEVLIIQDHGKRILYRREGSRWGIPNYYNCLEGLRPIRVLRYETLAPEESPFVAGIAVSTENQFTAAGNSRRLLVE